MLNFFNRSTCTCPAAGETRLDSRIITQISSTNQCSFHDVMSLQIIIIIFSIQRTILNFFDKKKTILNFFHLYSILSEKIDILGNFFEKDSINTIKESYYCLLVLLACCASTTKTMIPILRNMRHVDSYVGDAFGVVVVMVRMLIIHNIRLWSTFHSFSLHALKV